MPQFTESRDFIIRDASFVDVARDLHVHITSPIEGTRSSTVLPRVIDYFLPFPQQSSAPDRELKLSSKALEPILDNLIHSSPYSTLNWRTSIVDLLKVLGLDHSSPTRQKLALLMEYKGCMEPPYVEMNMWLHSKILEMLRNSGGDVERVVEYICAILNGEKSWVLV